MQVKRSLTKKEIDRFCRAVIYHLIDAYDFYAFVETNDISEKSLIAILKRMKFYASKFETDHIRCGTTNSILKSIKEKKDKK